MSNLKITPYGLKVKKAMQIVESSLVSKIARYNAYTDVFRLMLFVGENDVGGRQIWRLHVEPYIGFLHDKGFIDLDEHSRAAFYSIDQWDKFTQTCVILRAVGRGITIDELNTYDEQFRPVMSKGKDRGILLAPVIEELIDIGLIARV